MPDWAPREIVGPNCTHEQAAELWESMLNGSIWPNRREADQPAMMRSYIKRFVQFPYSCCVRAVERVIEEEKYFPPWATVRETIEAEWTAMNRLRTE